MKITIIAAIAENRVIGNDNKMLWHISEDFKRFKALTMDKPIIMGRKTFESLPGVLSGRKHIVISGNKKFKIDDKNCLVVNSVQAAIDACGNAEHAYVIGGGKVYTDFMSLADELELTIVHKEFEGDTKFPEFDLTWKLIESRKVEDEKLSYTFSKFERFPVNMISTIE